MKVCTISRGAGRLERPEPAGVPLLPRLLLAGLMGLVAATRCFGEPLAHDDKWGEPRTAGVVVAVLDSGLPGPSGGSILRYRVIRVIEQVPGPVALAPGDLISQSERKGRGVQLWQTVDGTRKPTEVYVMQVVNQDGKFVCRYLGEMVIAETADIERVAAIETAGMRDVERLRRLPVAESAVGYRDAVRSAAIPSAVLVGGVFDAWSKAGGNPTRADRVHLIEGLAAAVARPDAPHYVRTYAAREMLGEIDPRIYGEQETAVEALVTAFHQLLPEAGHNYDYENMLLVNLSLALGHVRNDPAYNWLRTEFDADLVKYRVDIQAKGLLWNDGTSDGYPLYQWHSPVQLPADVPWNETP